MNTSKLISSYVNSVSKGMLFINTDGVLEIINEQAQEIMGFKLSGRSIHEAGRIEKGDLVLLISTELGGDDGGLDPEDLRVIGVGSTDIRPGDIFLAIGRYKSSKRSVYQYYRPDSLHKKAVLHSEIGGIELFLSLDVEQNKVSIQIDDKEFSNDFQKNYGHMVVLDSKDQRVKFFQDRGYSYRHESIRELLQGKPFAEKTLNDKLQLSGTDIWELFPDDVFLSDIEKVIRGEVIELRDQLYSIHQRTIVASLRALKDPDLVGVCVEFFEVSDLPDQLSRRNNIVKLMEKNENVNLGESDDKSNGKMLGQGKRMRELRYMIKKASQVPSKVLITGENGTGKTLVAREIHRQSEIKKPFVEVNCASIPSSLFESEFFGYLPGSFTGASTKGKKGYLESAQGGSILLDEITEIPPDMQVKLLHVLQDKRFFPIGSTEPVELNARIIAASNRNLIEEIKAGRFREDLYYRLNVFSIHIPPLRERLEDIPQLTDGILRKLENRYGLETKEISSALMDKLLKYSWPGNIRELENVLEKAMLISDTKVLFPEYVQFSEEKVLYNLQEIREQAEKNAITQALLLHNNKAEVARLLGISRSTLYEKMSYYHLS